MITQEKVENTLALLFSLTEKLDSEGIPKEIVLINIPAALQQYLPMISEPPMFREFAEINGFNVRFVDEGILSYTIKWEE